MTVTQKRYLMGQLAARAWLDKNESFYSGAISDDILAAVVKVVIDADEAERIKELPKA